jgi:hypothetical protein
MLVDVHVHRYRRPIDRVGIYKIRKANVTVHIRNFSDMLKL